MINIYKIAELASCAPSTVSKALNGSKEISEKKRNEILSIAKEYKYIPNQQAQSLITKKSKLLGIIYEEELGMGIAHHFYSKVIEYFRIKSQELGYDIMFINNNLKINDNAISYLEHCQLRQIEGLFIPSFFGNNDEEIKEILKSPIPIVVTDEGLKFMKSFNTALIHSNDYLGGIKATEYLLALNHTNIVHLAGPYEGANKSIAALERIRGYKEAMNNAHLVAYSEHVFMANDFSFKSGYETMKKIIAMQERPTAIFAGSDILALGAMKLIQEEKLSIPHDLSLIGYDNLDILEYITPGLTSINQKKEDIGSNAAQLLINRIKTSTDNCTHHEIPTNIVERSSCIKI